MKMTFELKMMLAGSVLLVLSLLYDFMIVDVIYKNAAPSTYAVQYRHLFVSEWIFKAGFVVILLSLCIRVVKGLRSKKSK